VNCGKASKVVFFIPKFGLSGKGFLIVGLLGRGNNYPFEVEVCINTISSSVVSITMPTWFI
jgi:hypothetical protein